MSLLQFWHLNDWSTEVGTPDETSKVACCPAIDVWLGLNKKCHVQKIFQEDCKAVNSNDQTELSINT